MNNMDEAVFKRTVEHIFSNWTGLRLAVEHSMGGPNSQQVAIDFVDYITKYCLYETNVDAIGIQEALEDIMDQEFDTICEDDSPKEIANLLYRFLAMYKEGNVQEYEVTHNNLPVGNLVLSKPAVVHHSSTSANVSSEETGMENTSIRETPMEEEDPEWTQVRRRKR